MISAAILVLAATGCGSKDVAPSPTPSPSPSFEFPYQDPSLPIDQRVDDLLSHMAAEDKIGQMAQIEEGSLSPDDVSDLWLGSVLHGGGTVGTGTPDEWLSVTAEHQREAVEDTRLGIPIIYGVDAVHGFGALYGGTVFPHQIGLGAANDPDLVERIGRATAEEAAAVGVRWTFSPVLAIPSDIRWGRTYEAYSQDPVIVASLGAAYIRGIQGDDLTDPASVIATAKHFIGDGSTVYGSSTQFIVQQYLLDQGNTPANPALLRDVLLPPYQDAIDAGARTVMVSFSSWDGVKIHGNQALVTDTLREDLGFTGFVVSDWAGCDHINPDDFQDSIARCVNAGVDMVMVPYDAEAFKEALSLSLMGGDVSIDRIDEAVRRILTVKFEMGLFENPYPDPTLLDTIGSAEHRALAREAVAKSLVLLENDGVLPLSDSAQTIAVVGNAADDMGIQAGGWTMSWQGDSGPVIPGTTILEGITERAEAGVTVLDELPDSGMVDVCVAAVGERPYAEGVGDSTDLALPGLSVLDTLEGRCDSTVLVVVSGRPVIITDALGKADAVVAAWLPGTAGEGVADVLFGDVPFTGRLPMNWPRDLSQVPSASSGDEYLYPIGYGLTY